MIRLVSNSPKRTGLFVPTRKRIYVLGMQQVTFEDADETGEFYVIKYSTRDF